VSAASPPGDRLRRQLSAASRGIATFTTDLTDAIAREFPAIECPSRDERPGKRYAYPPRVRFEIAESDLTSYRRWTS
jgi:hypothetical protein